MKLLSIIIIILLASNLQGQTRDPKEKNIKIKELDQLRVKEKEDDQSEENFFNSFVPTGTFAEFVTSGTAGSNDPFTIVIPRVEVLGSKFLSQTWKNRATLITSSGKKITLTNVNYELEKGAFALQNESSIFIIDGNKYDNIVFNGKTFKYLLNPVKGGKEYFEVIANNDEISILKQYSLSVREQDGNAPGYGLDKSKKYIKKHQYFVKQGDDFSKIKLKKSSIIALFPNKEAKLTAFAKNNKLSFKKESDIRQIISSN